VGESPRVGEGIPREGAQVLYLPMKGYNIMQLINSIFSFIFVSVFPEVFLYVTVTKITCAADILV
jgi:hypothetical protein